MIERAPDQPFILSRFGPARTGVRQIGSTPAGGDVGTASAVRAERATGVGTTKRVLAALDDVVLERAATDALPSRCALVGPARELPRRHVSESAGFAGEV